MLSAVLFCLAWTMETRSCMAANPKTWIDFQALQNKAVKLIFNAGKRDSPAPLLNILHWLPIRERIKYKLCMYIYKCLNGTAPQYLVDFITYKPKGTRFTRSSIDTTLLTSQYARTSIGDKSFCISGPSLWNSLPKNIREAHTLSGFKKGFKSYLYPS